MRPMSRTPPPPPGQCWPAAFRRPFDGPPEYGRTGTRRLGTGWTWKKSICSWHTTPHNDGATLKFNRDSNAQTYLPGVHWHRTVAIHCAPFGLNALELASYASPVTSGDNKVLCDWRPAFDRRRRRRRWSRSASRIRTIIKARFTADGWRRGKRSHHLLVPGGR